MRRRFKSERSNKKRHPNRVVACCCIFFCVTWWSAAFPSEKIKAYPEIGILSGNRSDHVRVGTAMVTSMTWITIAGKQGISCKWLHEKIPMEQLKKVVVFEEDDLTIMTDDNKERYGESSVYFESCNYKGMYRDPLLNWGKDNNTLLEWKNTNAYIDTEHSLLLIDYIGEHTGVNKDKYVRALFIDKKHQFYSNRKASGSVWNDIKKLKNAILK